MTDAERIAALERELAEAKRLIAEMPVIGTEALVAARADLAAAREAQRRAEERVEARECELSNRAVAFAACQQEARKAEEERDSFRRVCEVYEEQARRCLAGQPHPLEAEGERRWRAFLAAYDAWVTSPDHIGGPLFDAMLEAREGLEAALAASAATGGQQARLPLGHTYMPRQSPREPAGCAHPTDPNDMRSWCGRSRAEHEPAAGEGGGDGHATGEGQVGARGAGGDSSGDGSAFPVRGGQLGAPNVDRGRRGSRAADASGGQASQPQAGPGLSGGGDGEAQEPAGCGCNMPNGLCLCLASCNVAVCHPDKAAFIAPEVSAAPSSGAEGGDADCLADARQARSALDTATSTTSNAARSPDAASAYSTSVQPRGEAPDGGRARCVCGAVGKHRHGSMLNRCSEVYRFEDGDEQCVLAEAEHERYPLGDRWVLSHQSRHAGWVTATEPAPPRPHCGAMREAAAREVGRLQMRLRSHMGLGYALGVVISEEADKTIAAIRNLRCTEGCE